ncbi:MAG: nucleotidyltransferase domain-containing protein [Clostridiaceae bacterium]|nr:nucleotidyltransferase domain-containing protein [Clostridiaceae bacterium]
MYGINETVYNKLMDYFRKNNEIRQVILFGSRAKGKEKYNSDIDLWIECNEEYTGKIKYEIDDIVGVYSCDILFNRLNNQEIKEQIKRDGVLIYKK